MKPMHHRLSAFIASFLSLLILASIPVACAQSRGQSESPLQQFTTDWRENPVWQDGKAECAVYDATRIIYGTPRLYKARLYTDTEHLSAKTFTKSDTSEGRLVFKHHLREDISTENYMYHYSTMCYVGVEDLKSLKLDMGSQEDCGATFKQYINHAELRQSSQPSQLRWHQFSYFPNEGHKSGQSQPAANFAFQDALSMVLRGYPFEHPPRKPMTFMLLPDQTTNKWSPTEPTPMTVTYLGKETLDLPIGQVEAYHLGVAPAQAKQSEPPQPMHEYWFAVKGDDAPSAAGLHIMVRYKGPNGLTYKLREVERRAYWKR